jgi:acylphosphatase
MTARRLSIHGKVQGVFYRDWTGANARALGLAGWVRNLADKSVVAQLEGPAEAVDAMIARLWDGPPEVRAERIEVQEVEPEGVSDFERR